MDLLIVDRRETIDKLNCLLMRPCKLYIYVCVCVCGNWQRRLLLADYEVNEVSA